MTEDKRNGIPDALFEPGLYDDRLRVEGWQSPDLEDHFNDIMRLCTYRLGNQRHLDLLRAAADALRAADYELRTPA